jgi:Dyp-type peroxidase family
VNGRRRHGFRYFEERDLLGFVGGTENPGGQAAAAAVLVGPEDPRFTGGSYVIAQKYLHDMRAWNALPVEEQEKVLGRTKLSNIALPAGARSANSHVGADRRRRARPRPAADPAGQNAIRQRRASPALPDRPSTSAA